MQMKRKFIAVVYFYCLSKSWGTMGHQLFLAFFHWGTMGHLEKYDHSNNMILMESKTYVCCVILLSFSRLLRKVRYISFFLRPKIFWKKCAFFYSPLCPKMGARVGGSSVIFMPEHFKKFP